MSARDETLSPLDVCSLALYGTHALPIRLKIVIVSGEDNFLIFWLR